MILTINNLDLPLTIDTYSMFSGENFEEMEAEYYQDELGFKGEIDLEYDHAGVVRDLATYSVSEIENLVDRDVVIRVSLPVSTNSPQFYNYTTDSYTAEWEIDQEALIEAVINTTVDGQHLARWAADTGWASQVTFNAEGSPVEGPEDTIAVMMLDFWLQQYADSYNERMWEHETEVYSNNSKPSADMQAELDKLSKLRDKE